MDGLSLEYLDRLTERTGFKCSSLTPFEQTTDAVSWNAFIENLENCTELNGDIRQDPSCKCDIGIGAWFETANRLGVSFLPPFAYDNMRVVVNIDDTSLSGDGTFFITALDPLVWILILVLVAMFSVLKLLDRRFVPRSEKFQPLNTDHGRFHRVRHFLLKQNFLFRLRRALQSVCMFYLS